MSKSFLSSVAGASLLIIGVNIASKGIGFLREIIFAGSFGLSKDYDLYLLGTAIPFVLNNAIYYLAQNFFLPLYNQKKQQSGFHESFFLSKNILLFFISGAGVGALLFLASQFIGSVSGNNSTGESESIAVVVLRILALSIPVHAVISIASAYLQAKYDFKLAIISQVIPNIFVIIFVLAWGGSLGVIAIPLGYLIGSILQLSMILFKVKGLLYFRKASFLKILSSSGTALGLVVIIELSGQVSVIVDRMFLSEVDTGGIAALSYASTIFTLPISVIALAFATAIFPKLSELASGHQWSKLNETFKQAIDISNFIFIPIAAILYFFGDVIIQLLYQRGKFDQHATLLTASALKYYAIGLVFMAGSGIVHKLMLGAGHIKVLSFMMFSTVIIKTIGNLVLVPEMGFQGMALSTSISYIMLFLMPFLYIIYQHRMKLLKQFTVQFLLAVANLVISLFITKVVTGFDMTSLSNGLISIISFVFLYTLIGFVIRLSAVSSIVSIMNGLHSR